MTDDERPDAEPMGDRPELADQLRRLFADDRLTLPVAVHAQDAVLAGAKRRRRRRASVAAAGGVLAAAVVAFAGVGLAGLGHSGGTVSAASPALSVTTEPSAPTVSTVPATPTFAYDVGVIGPGGADGLYLGEPGEQMLKVNATNGTRTIDAQKSGAGCIAYTMIVPPEVAQAQLPPAGASTRPMSPTFPVPTTTVPAKAGLIDVVVSPEVGVVQIGGMIELRTPEGVRLGTPAGQLVRIYPKLAKDGAGQLVTPAPGGKDERYVFVLHDDEVAEIWLRSGATFGCVS